MSVRATYTVYLVLGPYKAGAVSVLQETEGKENKELTCIKSNQRETKYFA